MKKIFFTLFITALMFFSVGCERQEADLFSKNANQRVVDAIEEYKNLLTSSENGWVLEYYPGGKTQRFGGFTYVLKFENDKVLAKLDRLGTIITGTSTYDIISNGGPTLSFDEQNEALHFFSNPNRSNRDGFEGDFEFLLLSHSNDEILLKGKKYETVMRMVRLKENADDYLKKITDFHTLVRSRGIRKIKIGEQEFNASNTNRVIFYLEEQTAIQKEIKYIYTDKGMRLLTPLNVNGKEIQELLYDNSTGDVEFKDPEGLVSVVLYVRPPLNFTLSNYEFFADRTDWASPQIINLFKEVKEEVVNYVDVFTIDLESRFILGTAGTYGEGLYYRAQNPNKQVFQGSYHLYFYGDARNSKTLYIEEKSSATGTDIRPVLKLRRLLANNSPYWVEDTSDAKVKKLISQKDSTFWLQIKQVR